MRGQVRSRAATRNSNSFKYVSLLSNYGYIVQVLHDVCVKACNSR